MIGSRKFRSDYLDPFQDLDYRYIADRGFIVWRPGTGNNVELLHIRTFEKGKGWGKGLLDLMLNDLKRDPPYYSIFGFTRVGNLEAQKFYGALGFKLQEVNGLYKEGSAVLFWQSYKSLVERMKDYEDTLSGKT